MKRKMLIVATISGAIEDFLLPFIRYFRDTGWQVEGMALEISNSSICVAELDRVWDVQWSRNPLDPQNLIVAVPKIRAIIARGNYDLVHVHTPVAAFVTRYAVSNFKGVQRPNVIYTAHGFHFHSQGNPINNKIFLNLEKIAAAWTDYLIVINREDEAAARKHRLLPGNRIFYTPGIGLDLQEYDPERVSQAEIAGIYKELGITDKNPLLLTVAEFTPNKRHRDQLLALKKLDRPEVHLAFAGDGTIRPELEQLTKELELQQQVHFLGFRHDVPALICSSTVMLLTSAREGLPRSIMEAFCAATPVIGTKIRGIQDLLADDCGLLVDVGDIDALTTAIATVLDNPQEATRMGEHGRRKIANYDVNAIIEQYADIYRQALAARTTDRITQLNLR